MIALFNPMPVRKYEKQEERRLRRLERARERGDADARAMWVLPRSAVYAGPESWWDRLQWDKARDLDVIEVAVAGRRRRKGRVLRYRQPWLAALHLAYRCSPKLAMFPPAFDDRRRELSHVYLIAFERYWPGRHQDLLELDPEPGEEAAPASRRGRPVAADRDDMLRWLDAADAYLSVLDEVHYELRSYWRDRASELPLPWRKRRTFARWRALLEAGYERLREASDDYRSVFDEVTEAIEQTARARAELTERWQRVSDWEQRRLWRWVPEGDGFLVVRTDVGRNDLAEGKPGKPFYEVTFDAWTKRHHDLCPVGWDQVAIDASDAELAALFGDEVPEIGRTRSGSPMAIFPTMSFAERIRQRTGSDYHSFSDRDKLAEDVAEQERLLASIKRSAREPHPSAHHGPRGSDYGGGFDVSVHT